MCSKVGTSSSLHALICISSTWSLYLDVFVVFPEIHEPVVGLDGLSKRPYVDTHGGEVLPDLPVFVVALQGFLQGEIGFVPANNGDGKKENTDPS